MLTWIFSTVYFFSYVISGNLAFPKPLSQEDEQKYLQLYEHGCEKSKNILIEHNLRLVAHIAKKYSKQFSDNEDLISIGTIGLIKGISSFNLGKGTKLATYVARCIENEILMSIRSTKKLNNEVFLQDPIGKDGEGNEIMIMDTIPGCEDTIADDVSLKMQIVKLYEEMNDQLLEREKMILTLRYGLYEGHEYTQREIADMLKISRSYVSRIEKKALKKLSKNLEEF